MTPAARVAAAITILDRIAAGDAAEKALTNWARGARFAGSGDRAAIRDHVFDVIRRWRSTAVSGGGETGRCRMIGLLRQDGIEPGTLFTGEGHAAAPLDAAETTAGGTPSGYAGWDLPDWLAERLRAAHPDQAHAIAHTLRSRAPVFLRANRLKTTRHAAMAALARDGIETAPARLSQDAIRVLGNPRRVSQSQAFLQGLVELQDAASQAVVEALPLHPDMRVLDYCAGGGGKALAMAARTGGRVDVHDADPRRMKDIPARAARAGATLQLTRSPGNGYDLVLCDVPCSGSGAWRRAPEGKWRLTPAGLDALCKTQAQILSNCAGLVKPTGALAYATCSVFAEENREQIDRFVGRCPGWSVETMRAFVPDSEGDGLFVCVLRNNP